MACIYTSPYVKKFWSKRLYYNRPISSIRTKLRIIRGWSPKNKRMPSFVIRDIKMSERKVFRHYSRINYANR